MESLGVRVGLGDTVVHRIGRELGRVVRCGCDPQLGRKVGVLIFCLFFPTCLVFPPFCFLLRYGSVDGRSDNVAKRTKLPVEGVGGEELADALQLVGR